MQAKELNSRIVNDFSERLVNKVNGVVNAPNGFGKGMEVLDTVLQATSPRTGIR